MKPGDGITAIRHICRSTGGQASPARNAGKPFAVLWLAAGAAYTVPSARGIWERRKGRIWEQMYLFIPIISAKEQLQEFISRLYFKFHIF